jgi:hypothetical protein
MFTAEGSGSLDDFRETMSSGLLPKDSSGWKDSIWTAIKFGEFDASHRELVPVPETHQQWRLFVMDGGRFYHAVILNASTSAMTVSGDFYENVVRTFEGVRE